jgi:hypothetical protein
MRLCIIVIVIQNINIVDVQQTHKVVVQLSCENATQQTHVTTNVSQCMLLVTHSQVTGPLEGSTESSCGKLRLGGTLPASNSRKG